jgi:hypothetical protein
VVSGGLMWPSEKVGGKWRFDVAERENCGTRQVLVCCGG